MFTGPTSSGVYDVELRTAPEQPPTRGLVDFELRISSILDNAPAPGLVVTLTPWMPAMGHGTDSPGEVTEQGDGTYEVRDVDLFMAGDWELRFALTTSGSSDEDEISIPCAVR